MRTVVAVLLALARERCRPLLAVSFAAWILIGYDSVAGNTSALCLSATALPPGMDALTAIVRQTLTVDGLRSATLMLAAMMLPLLPAQVMRVCDGSLADRRGRAVALFLAGYAAVAVPCVLVLTMLAAIGALLVPAPIQTVATVAIAAIWQITHAKRFALLRCHRRPLLPLFGARGEIVRFRFGVETGAACMLSCWAMMLVPFAAGAFHGLAMAAVFLLLLRERFGAAEPLGSRAFGMARQISTTVAA